MQLNGAPIGAPFFYAFIRFFIYYAAVILWKFWYNDLI